MDTDLLEERPLDLTFRDPVKNIPHTAFEKGIVGSVRGAFQFYSDVGVETPVFLMVTLLNVSGYRIILTDPNFPRLDDGQPIDRETLPVPELLVDDLSADVPRTLRPVFDAVWNAAGYIKSANYDSEGRWTPQQP